MARFYTKGWLMAVLLLFLFTSGGCEQIPVGQSPNLSLQVCEGENCRSGEIDNGRWQTNRLALVINNLGKNSTKISWNKDNWIQPLKHEKVSGDGVYYLERPDFGWVNGWYEARLEWNGETLTKKIYINGREKKKPVYNKYFEWREYDKNNGENLTVETAVGELMKSAETTMAVFSPYSQQPTGISDENGGPMVRVCRELIENECQNPEIFFINEDQEIYLEVKNADKAVVHLYWEGLAGLGESLAVANVDDGQVVIKMKNISWPSGVYWTEIYQNNQVVKIAGWQVLPADSGLIEGKGGGFYTNRGDWIGWDNTGILDEFQVYHQWGEKIDMAFSEKGEFDEWGNFLLEDGSGYYDRTGFFWFWRESYGDGEYLGGGNFAVEGGVIDVTGNFRSN